MPEIETIHLEKTFSSKKKTKIPNKNEQNKFKPNKRVLPNQNPMVRAIRLFSNPGQFKPIPRHTSKPSWNHTQLGQLLRSIQQKVRVQDHFQLP